MKNSIKLYRVVLNVLFYMFYVLLASIAFSFIFPTILVILWQDILAPNNPIFDAIQIVIIILVLVFSLIFRKYFYLPIRSKLIISKSEIKNKTNNEVKKVEKKEIKEEKNDNSIELDIKIGKEIK